MTAVGCLWGSNLPQLDIKNIRPEYEVFQFNTESIGLEGYAFQLDIYNIRPGYFVTQLGSYATWPEYFRQRHDSSWVIPLAQRDDSNVY